MKRNGVEEEVYTVIRDYIARHGRPPTLREIGEACFMSTTNVLRYLDRLEAHGRIQRKRGSRGITLLDNKGT